MALDYIVPQGGTDQTVYVFLHDGSGNGVTGQAAADLAAYYTRPLDASATSISLSDLATADAVHSDGGVFEVDATNMPGVYRIDLPDAMIARGENFAVLIISGTNIADVNTLVYLDPEPTIIQGQVLSSPTPSATQFGVDIDVSADELNDSFLLFVEGATQGSAAANQNVVKKVTDTINATTSGSGNDEVITNAFPAAPSSGDWFVVINR